MSAAPTIPRGWRRLRVGTILRKHDRWISCLGVSAKTNYPGEPVYDEELYIRRVAKKKGRK
jgi:hypothetical protein